MAALDNYLPFVSWGMYGAENAPQRAHFFASWGLMKTLYNGLGIIVPKFVAYYRRLRS